MTQQEQEPGELGDLELGVPGEAEPLPADDAEQDEPTEINDDEEDGEDA